MLNIIKIEPAQPLHRLLYGGFAPGRSDRAELPGLVFLLRLVFKS
jgi:hypothetical protein